MVTSVLCMDCIASISLGMMMVVSAAAHRRMYGEGEERKVMNCCCEHKLVSEVNDSIV